MPQNRQQELKPALPEWQQFLFNFKNNPLTALNPGIVNDPVYQKTEELGEVLYPMLDPNDPLNQIQTAAAKNPAVAGILAAARLAKRKKKVKAPAPTTQAAPAIIKKDPGEQLAKKLNKNELFHASPTTGIETLKIPKPLPRRSDWDMGYGRQSSGGIYTTTGIMDPRLMLHAKRKVNNPNVDTTLGSVYAAKPKFERTFDAQKINPKMRKYLEDTLRRKEGNPSPIGNRQTAAGIDQILNINSKSHRGLGYPTYASDDLANVFKEADFLNSKLKNYDSLFFGPRTRTSRKSSGDYAETDTVLSLKDLDVSREIPYEEMIELFERAGKYYPGKY